MPFSSIEINVEVTGPLFDGGGGQKLAHKWTKKMVQQLTEKGEQRLDDMLRPRPGGVYKSVEDAGRNASIGHYRSNVVGKQRDLVAIITDSGVVYGPWLEGTSSRNQTTRFKGYFSFRKTRQYLRRNKEKLIRPIIRKMMRNLGG